MAALESYRGALLLISVLLNFYTVVFLSFGGMSNINPAGTAEIVTSKDCSENIQPKITDASVSAGSEKLSMKIFHGTPPEDCDNSKLANQRDFATTWLREFVVKAPHQYDLFHEKHILSSSSHNT